MRFNSKTQQIEEKMAFQIPVKVSFLLEVFDIQVDKKKIAPAEYVEQRLQLKNMVEEFNAALDEYIKKNR